ncbi:FYVE zinc finger domain-containing protein [Kocuria palustris]|nr:FYVE zinc finger domain-containing protein [Kocuria palustris]
MGKRVIGAVGAQIRNTLTSSSKEATRSQSPLPSPTKSPISRSIASTDDEHLPAPSTSIVGKGCGYPGCNKSMTPRNGGCVECSKCHKFVCNQHGRYKTGLTAEGGYATIEQNSNLSLRRVCLECFSAKPDLSQGTQTKVHDLTRLFKSLRSSFQDSHELRRNKTQLRFIRLVNKDIEATEKQDYWERDDEVAHCRVCGVTFLWWIRKHHCRLCGQIVCDDPEGNRQFCSLMAPVGLFVEKLPDLNYNDEVKQNLSKTISDNARFRCCVKCKDDLLVNWKRNQQDIANDENAAVFDEYNTFILQKHHLNQLLASYAKELSPRISSRLAMATKELEKLATRYRVVFFDDINGKLTPKSNFNPQLVRNIYQSIILALEHSVTEFKRLSSIYQAAEEEKLELKKQQQREIEAQIPPASKLTKKEIRELREQLMVMNEQKFLVELMIKEYTKLRKFDELASLQVNSLELEATIKDLESQLGEFGF